MLTQRQLRNNTADIVRALERGDSFVITRYGIPVGRLTPMRRRTFVPVTELLESATHLGKIDPAQFRADIDAYINQDPTPRV
jgi:prevent-host-death family protein